MALKVAAPWCIPAGTAVRNKSARLPLRIEVVLDLKWESVSIGRSALRLDHDRADFAAAFDLLVRRRGLVKREASSHRQDAARGSGPAGDIGLGPAPLSMRNPGERHRVDREVFLHQVA